MYNKQLETFLCAADTGSFSKAAKQLYLSTSGVIKQVQLLEQHLGVPLFTRSSQGIFLTPAGRLIYRDAKKKFTILKSISLLEFQRKRIL